MTVSQRVCQNCGEPVHVIKHTSYDFETGETCPSNSSLRYTCGGLIDGPGGTSCNRIKELKQQVEQLKARLRGRVTK